jgi:hypothetical protein
MPRKRSYRRVGESGYQTVRLPKPAEKQRNRSECRTCKARKGQPCRSVNPGGPAQLSKIHSNKPQPDWSIFKEKKAQLSAPDRAKTAAETAGIQKASDAPGASLTSAETFVPKT